MLPYHYSYYAGLYSGDPWILSIVLMVFSTIVAIAISACVIEIILRTLARWHIYKKAKVEVWKCLIPFYNVYQDVKLAWSESWALTYIFSSIGVCILSTISLTGSVLFEVLAVLGALFLVVIHIIYCVKLSRAFGHGAGWAVGLIFLEVIFKLMIALGKSKYSKAAPRKEPEKIEEKPKA